ncbi:hypothetical protein EPUS_01632 [Endocarpon pusillum Z07020]|uniref:Ribosomal RNA-processing protein 42 n=1 Tax=Endocarpon pusillum (strain Z07020 / HMAS-L-300199) TaxID=1263415 RepID=U1GDX1_ENDPU|nr:uncharacterized protein EPUS_01632 [Endocarpon pusillum Z07020]ERF75802.1 hypothetical protein EPUS_01632 [Endocarpon pusillum Z07020]
MPTTSTPTTLSPAELSYLHTSLTQTPPLRPDLRSPTEFRPLRAETDLLPTCNGSAHVSLTDGSEALVGIKAEVHRTAGANVTKRLDEEMHEKMSLDEPSSTISAAAAGLNSNRKPRGHPDWISLNVDISTLRDDDPLLIFLSEMLREPLLTTSSATTTAANLADMLVINSNWHWHLHIDILLLSPFTASGTSYPLPLLSLATHLALRSARLPKLKSQGEEDPLVDDDWESSLFLFPPPTSARKPDSASGNAGANEHSIPPEAGRLSMPPITLLVMTVNSNIIFDPSHSELAVADAVLAVSVAFSDTTTHHHHHDDAQTPTLLAIRTIETPARDTMRGVPAAGEVVEGELVPGVWKPKVGGVKREVLKRVVRAVVGTGGDELGVAREVFDGLEAFLRS